MKNVWYIQSVKSHMLNVSVICSHTTLKNCEELKLIHFHISHLWIFQLLALFSSITFKCQVTNYELHCTWIYFMQVVVIMIQCTKFWKCEWTYSFKESMHLCRYKLVIEKCDKVILIPICYSFPFPSPLGGDSVNINAHNLISTFKM